MQLIQDITESFTIYDAVLHLRGLAFIQPALKKLVEKIEVPPEHKRRPGIQTGVAIQMVSTQIKESIATRDTHPRTILDNSVSVMPTRVTPYSVTVQDMKMDVTLSYVVPQGESTVALRTHIADVVAYSYTPKEKSSSGAMLPTFDGARQGTFPKVGVTKSALDGWSADATKNSTELYTAMSDSKKMFTYAHCLTASIRDQPGMASIFKPLKLSSTATIGTPKDGGREIFIPNRSVPPMTSGNAHTLDSAYMFMTMSRKHRGENKDYISPLTAGYYWNSCTRATNSLFCNTVDIVNLLLRAKIGVLVVERGDLSENVLSSVAANGMVVLRLSSSIGHYGDQPIIVKPKDQSPYIVAGVYNISNLSVLAEVPYIRYTRMTTDVAPTVSKQGVVKYAPKDTYERAKLYIADSKIPFFTIMYAAPEVFTFEKVNIYPSTQAHTGLVIVTSVELLAVAKVTASAHAWRVINANMCKTWFPYCRFPFHLRDKAVHGIEFLPYQSDSGVVLQGFATARKSREVVFDLAKDPTEAQVPEVRIPPALLEWGYEGPAPGIRPPLVQTTQVLDQAYGIVDYADYDGRHDVQTTIQQTDEGDNGGSWENNFDLDTITGALTLDDK